MKEFDYYIFIDYSENLIGYSIIEKEKLRELLPKISRFRHYREAGNKKVYRVRASVYPTHHNKIWLSSGRIPLYKNYRTLKFINLSVFDVLGEKNG